MEDIKDMSCNLLYVHRYPGHTEATLGFYTISHNSVDFNQFATDTFLINHQ